MMPCSCRLQQAEPLWSPPLLPPNNQQDACVNTLQAQMTLSTRQEGTPASRKPTSSGSHAGTPTHTSTLTLPSVSRDMQLFEAWFYVLG